MILLQMCDKKTFIHGNLPDQLIGMHKIHTDNIGMILA